MKKHLHILDLVKYFEKYKETKFVLIHFSCRYTLEELKIYQQEYEARYCNITFFI